MFRTEIPLSPDPRQLTRTARVLTLGSCFAATIGGRLATHKVSTLVNPFGTVFNPLSATLLLRAAAGEPVDWSQHLVEARGRWQSYDLHGSIGADSAEALLARIQELVRQTADFAKSADVLLLTLGTAWVYRLLETGELVSNCHKQPAALFEKELLSAEDIVGQVAEAHALLRRLNPQLRLVLTVSPVRHLRDTLPLNTVSKSVLRLATHYLSDLLPEVSYFPAFELLTDDLRDYRFYAADMLHPSTVAEEYIWERFVRTYFDAEFGRFRKEWDGIQQALAHRPLHPGAPEHRQFLESTLEKLRRLAGQQVEVRAEIRDVERRLLALPPPPRPKPVAAPEAEEDGEERIDIGQVDEEVATGQAEPVVASAVIVAAAATPDADAAAFPAGPRPAPEVEALRSGRNRGRGRPKQRQPEPAGSQVVAEKQFGAEPEAAATTVEMPARPAPRASYTDFLISSAPELVRKAPHSVPAAPAAPETLVQAVPDEAVTAEEPAQKKKRRSRGGAKRTARKNAARLAAEQVGLDPIDPAGLAGATETDFANQAENQVNATNPDETAVASRASAPETGLLADTATGAALIPPPAGTSASSKHTVPVADAEQSDIAQPSDAPQASEPAGPAVVATDAALPAPKKRGTGPVVRKSKVITKSESVKRGTRRGVGPAASPAGAVAAASIAGARPADTEKATLKSVVPAAVADAAAVNEQPEVIIAAQAAASTTAPARPPKARPTTAKTAKAAPKPKAASKPAASAVAKPGKKTAPAVSRARKPAPGDASPKNATPSVAPAVQAAAATAAPVAATPAAEAPTPRRGRPPGTRKVRASEPAGGKKQ